MNEILNMSGRILSVDIEEFYCASLYYPSTDIYNRNTFSAKEPARRLTCLFFLQVILKRHGLLDRHRLLLDSCISSSVSDEGLREMRQAGLGKCILSWLPPWVLKYAAGLVRVWFHILSEFNLLTMLYYLFIWMDISSSFSSYLNIATRLN
jgi:hypothetical protein